MVARASIALGFLVVCSGLALVRADETPLDRLELDKRLARVVHDASLRGAELWDEKNFEGTYRLYEGTLRAVQPLLDHHPKLADVVNDRLEQAAELPHTKGAFVLREALDAVQKETAKALTPRTAWDRIRGEAGARAIARDFLIAAIADPKVNATRGGSISLDAKKLDTLEQYVVEWVSQELEGPLKYTGPEIRKAFAGLDVKEAEFDAAVGHFESVLKKYNVPPEESKKLLTAANRLKTQIVTK